MVAKITERLIVQFTNKLLNMVLWKIFFFSCIYSICEATLQHDQLSPEEYLEERLLLAKAQIAKKVINSKRDSSKLLNVSATEPLVFEVGLNGGSSFAAFTQVLILADNLIHSIGDSDGYLKLNPIVALPNLASTDKLAFIKAVEKRNILFILVALISGYCKLYTATPSMNITQRQTIYNYGPQDAEFFNQENELFLVIISSKPESYNVPSHIYRWTGTHFDEIKTFLTRGAVAVSTFPFKGSVIITVAQYPKDKPMIGSQVFRWYNNQLERMQFLATNGPVAVQHLEANGESYLIVVNDFEYSSVFWWTGREFVNWDSFNDARGMNKISVGYTEEEPIILIAKHDKIKVYKLLENKLQSLTTVSLFEGEEIISMSIHMNVESRLVVVSKRYGVLSTSIFHLQLFKGHIGDYIQKTDQLLQCLKDVIDTIEAREDQMNVMRNEYTNMLKLSDNATLLGKIIVNGTISIKNTLIKKCETHSNGSTLERNILDINEKVNILTESINYQKEEADSLVQKSISQSLSGKFYFQKDLNITNCEWDEAPLIEINGKTFKYLDMLDYKSDQIITGEVDLNTMTASVLHVTSLHGIPLEDLLLKNNSQMISGYHELRELTTRILYTPLEYKINEIQFSKLAAKDIKIVHGHKKLNGLHTNYLRAQVLNEENLPNLGDKYVRKNGGQYEIKALNFQSPLTIDELIVEDINGLNWDEFMSEAYLLGEHQSVNGDFTFTDDLKIDSLLTKQLNKYLTDDLITSTNDQDIISTIEVGKLKVKDLLIHLFNGIDLNTNVALLGNVNNIKGTVNMDSAKVRNITTTDRADWFAKWAGINRKPILSYKKKVVISGNLQVEDISLMTNFTEINGSQCEIESIKDIYWARHHPQKLKKEKFQIETFSIVGDVLLNKINNINSHDLLHITESKRISDIEFEGLRVENGLDLEDHIRVSGINLYEMNRTAVMTNGNYIMNGNKIFFSGLTTDNLLVTEINGKKISNIIPLKEEKHLLGRKSFSKIIIRNDLHVEDDNYIGTLNSVNITSKLPLALSTDRSFSVDSMSLSAVVGKSVETLTINEFLFDDLVKTLHQQTSTIKIKEVKINGDFEFLSDLEIEYVNDIALQPYLKEVVDKRVSGEITGKKQFLGEVVFNFLEASAINGLDIIYLEKNVISKTKPQNLTGNSTIKKIQSVNFIAEEVNGKNIDDAIVILDQNNHNIYSDVKFSNLIVKGGLKIEKIKSCDPAGVHASLYSSIKHSHIDKLNISQSITWKYSNTYENSLSNYFEKALLQKGNNVVQGKVIFLNNIYSEYVDTGGVINGINLTALIDDCVMSSMEQNLYGQKIFINSINASRVDVHGNANIKFVNEIDIIGLNRTLVRKSLGERIYGFKHFQNYFKAEKLTLGGKLNGISLSNIATIDDEMLPPAKVNNLEVTDHLEVVFINKINLTAFLQGRVNCNDSQEISSKLLFNDTVGLIGKTQSLHVNHIYFENILRADSHIPQRIIGKKQFEQDVLVNGKIHVYIINDKNVEESYRLGIQSNEDLEIQRNVVFVKPLKIDSYINGSLTKISEKYNNLKEMYKNIHEKLHLNHIEMEHCILESMELIKVIPYELAYLEYEDFTIKGINIVSAKPHISDENAVISLFGNSKETCNLPKGCLCSSQYELHIDENLYSLIPKEDNGRLFTDYNPYSKLGVEVYTNTTSYDSRCKYSAADDYEESSIMSIMSWNNEIGSLTYNLDFEKYSFKGYVSDVRILSLGKYIYIAIAIYYDSYLSSHNVNSFIIRWSDKGRSPDLFQYIPTYGAKLLELFHSEEEVYLFIGNSYDSYKRTNQVDSEVYRLNQKSNQFLNLRSIKTRGINSATSLVLKDDKFIIVSQKLSTPLLILKYNKDFDNFYLYQKLYFGDTIAGVGSFYIAGSTLKDAYLGVAVIDGSFHIYKYSQLQGFRKVMNSWQAGITSIIPISIGKRQLILTPSKLKSDIISIVFQGRENH